MKHFCFKSKERKANDHILFRRTIMHYSKYTKEICDTWTIPATVVSSLAARYKFMQHCVTFFKAAVKKTT